MSFQNKNEAAQGTAVQTIKLTPRRDHASNWIDIVRQQVNSIHYGAVQIIVHGSRVVQIETTTRLRFDYPQPEARTPKASENQSI